MRRSRTPLSLSTARRWPRLLPLILAATEPLDAIYRSLNSSPALAASGIRGNPEALTDDELAAAARSVLDELYAAELAAVRATFEPRFHEGRASSDVATVARAATIRWHSVRPSPVP